MKEKLDQLLDQVNSEIASSYIPNTLAWAKESYPEASAAILQAEDAVNSAYGEALSNEAKTKEFLAALKSYRTLHLRAIDAYRKQFSEGGESLWLEDLPQEEKEFIEEGLEQLRTQVAEHKKQTEV